MRILAISDVHSNFEHFAPETLQDADICLFAGDLTNFGRKSRPRIVTQDPAAHAAGTPPSLPNAIVMDDMQRAALWLRQLADRMPVYWIPGNHDLDVDADTFGQRAGCTCILNRTVAVNGVTIHGVSLAPCYDRPILAKHWAYMTTSEREERAAFTFEAVDVVVSHSPPFGHCDRAFGGAGAPMRCIGSAALLAYIERHEPRLVICGHVHEARGTSLIRGSTRDTAVWNVSCGYEIIDLPDALP